METPWIGPLMNEGRQYPPIPDWALMNKESSGPLLPDCVIIDNHILLITWAYDMVDDPATDAVVSWRPDGRSFVVWDVPRLTRDLLPKYLSGYHDFTTFTLHLIICGFKFKLLNRDQVEFAKAGFVKGKRNVLKIQPNFGKPKRRGETDQEVKEEIKEETKDGIKVENKETKKEIQLEIKKVEEEEIKKVKDLTSSSSLQKLKKRRIDGSTSNF